jgi:lipocalin
MGSPWFADSVIRLQENQRLAEEHQEQTTQPAPKFSPDPGLRGTAFPTTFYPNAQSVEQASLVRLDAGGEAQVSITLSPARAVSVTGTISVPGGTSAGRAILFKKVHDTYVSFLDGWISNGGTFRFDNVPPGSYEIVATSQADTGASSWHVRDEVEVGVVDTEVTLTSQPMGSLSGRVFFEGERPAPTADLFVSLRNEEGSLDRAEVSPDGSFSLRRLPAGRYEVTAGNTDYIAAYLTGPDGERLPLTLTISGEPVHRDLTLTRAVSVIEGTVESAGVPQVGAFVLLMPKNPSERWAYRVDQTDSDGSYRLGTIPSGEYFLIALSDGNDVAYRDAKVAAILTKAATPVHVDAGDHLEVKITY